MEIYSLFETLMERLHLKTSSKPQRIYMKYCIGIRGYGSVYNV
ncbi:hypothetical protein Gogos_021606, partial [Gossypium gossypioides]|nr:hypothetical protein [Gossypium gossypioides]